MNPLTQSTALIVRRRAEGLYFLYLGKWCLRAVSAVQNFRRLFAASPPRDIEDRMFFEGNFLGYGALIKSRCSSQATALRHLA